MVDSKVCLGVVKSPLLWWVHLQEITLFWSIGFHRWRHYRKPCSVYQLVINIVKQYILGVLFSWTTSMAYFVRQFKPNEKWVNQVKVSGRQFMDELGRSLFKFWSHVVNWVVKIYKMSESFSSKLKYWNFLKRINVILTNERFPNCLYWLE